MEVINATDPAPDVVIHTGDITHDALPEEYSTARRLLDKLEFPYFVMAGNRDNRARLIDVFADGKYICEHDEFIQYPVEDFAVRLLLLDTVSADGNSAEQTASNKGELCEQRLALLDSMLAADTGRPVAIFMHHSPFEATAIPDPFQFDDWNEVDRFHALLAGYPQVRGIYCGHIHRNAEAVVGGINIQAITCMACDLRKGQLTDTERSVPAIRVLDYPDT